MNLLRETVHKAKTKIREMTAGDMVLLVATVFCVLYLIGVCSTLFDKRIKGISFFPLAVFQSLFSVAGLRMLVIAGLLVALGFGIHSVRNLRYAGQEKDARGFRYSNTGIYGTSRMMNDQRMHEVFDLTPEKHLQEAEGDILGKKDGYVISNRRKSTLNRNCAIYGATNSMKSVAVCRNMIIGAVRRGESMVVSDTKGEIFREVALWLRKEGYVVRIFNTKNQQQSHSWNFLYDIITPEKNISKELNRLSQVATTIIENTGGPNVEYDFWDKAERGLLKAIILYQIKLYRAKSAPLSFARCYDFLINNTVEQMEKCFTTVANGDVRDPALLQFRIFKTADKMTSNIRFGLLNRLDMFLEPSICEMTTANEIDFTLPGKQKCAYFVVTSDQDSVYTPIISLFFSLFFMRAVEYADMLEDLEEDATDTTTTDAKQALIPINMILDEFSNLGRLPDFDKKISTVRSRKINVVIIFQSLPQLETVYPNKVYLGILGNCDTSVFLGTTDTMTAEYISKRIGTASVVVETNMERKHKLDPFQFAWEHREAVGVGKRSVMNPDEVLRMAEDDPLAELILVRNQGPLLCRKFVYDENPEVEDWEPIRWSQFQPHDPFWTSNESEADRLRRMDEQERMNQEWNNRLGTGHATEPDEPAIPDLPVQTPEPAPSPAEALHTPEVEMGDIYERARIQMKDEKEPEEPETADSSAVSSTGRPEL